MNHKVELRATATPWNAAVQFLLRQGSATAEPIVMKQRDEAVRLEPSFHLDNAMAQQLMDDLWVCGLRPTEGTGSAGALQATQRHLEDMRKIAFTALAHPKLIHDQSAIGGIELH